MAYILIVDDDVDILKIVSHVLSASGHFVFTAVDAEEAMSQLNSKRLDLIITDANMPRHSGYDLLHTLKQNTTYKNIPVAFLTGRRDKKDIEKAVKMGASDYIIKPIDPFLLVQKVTQILSQYGEQVASIEIAQTNISNKASIELPTVIVSLSEVGLEIRSTDRLKAGQNIKLDSVIFKEIGIHQPHMKILSCHEVKDSDCFNIKLQFIGMTDQDLQKIRAWMIRSNASNVA